MGDLSRLALLRRESGLSVINQIELAHALPQAETTLPRIY